jgi:uncharacterized secreted protein with C-terminal beta-propeller domain
MGEKELDAYVSENRLLISVNNLGELDELIEEIVSKQKDLQKSVEKIRRYRLEITFMQQNQKQNQLTDQTEQSK